MGAYSVEEQPVLTRHGGPSCPRPTRQCLCCWFVTFALVALFVYVMNLCWYDEESKIPPDYSISITAVSGVRPRPGDGPAEGRAYGACIGPYTAVEVSYSYLRLPLASGSTPGVCVGPLELIGPRAVVVHGRDVAVPGFLVDSLAEEMRSGEAMVEVKLIEGGGGGWWDVETRWVRVEAAADRL
uniref:Uncharacterized protein n=1 Tax=Setaria viridis TaxID=4556 RepID=A0A4U6WE27_SETVI|nr:hypothetical protein SEVIR_1G241800v2 [Setaria viridis]